MKKFLILILVFFLAQSGLAEIPALKLGVIVPLSGPLAYVGEDIKNGVLLGVDQVKDSLKVTPIFEDNAYDLKNTVTAAHKLVDQDKVNALITLWDGADVAAPISEKAKVLHLSIRWNPGVTEGRPLTFTVESTYKTYAKDQIELLKYLGIKKIGIIQSDSQGNELEARELTRLAKPAGIEVVGHETHPENERDFKALITRLLSKSPDMLLLRTWPPATEIILKQLNQLRPGFKHSGYYEVVEDKSLLEGAPFVAQLEFTPDFNNKFKAKFGTLPKIRAAHAYEIVRLINWAHTKLPQDKEPTAENLAAVISTLKDFDSSLGKLSVNETRNIEHPDIWKVYKNGVPYITSVGGKLP